MANITRPSLGDRIRNTAFNLILRFQARKYRNNPELFVHDLTYGIVNERMLSAIDIKTIEAALPKVDIESFKKIIDVVANKLDLSTCLIKLKDEKYTYLLSKVDMTEEQFDKELNWLLENDTSKIKLLIKQNSHYLTPDLLSIIYKKTDSIWDYVSEDIQEKPRMFDVMLSNIRKERNGWEETKVKDENKFIRFLDMCPVNAVQSFFSNNLYLRQNYPTKLTYHPGKSSNDTTVIQSKTIVKKIIEVSDRLLARKSDEIKKDIYVLIFNGIRPDLMDDELFVALFKRINPNLGDKEINKRLARFNLIKSSFPEVNTNLNPDFLLIDGIDDNIFSRFSTNISLQEKLLKISSTSKGKKVLDVFLKSR